MLALRSGGELVEECETEHTRRRHAQTLVLEAQSLLRRHQLVAADVNLIAVSIGPGSFTGLRVGVVFAKTFAFATSAKLVAVDTLQALALAAGDQIQHVFAVSDAQREQLFVGDYKRVSGDIWNRHADIIIEDNDAWMEKLPAFAAESFAVTGPGLAKVADRIPHQVIVLDPTDWHPRASHVGIIGEQKADRSEFADAFTLEPFYLRKSAAEEKRDLAQIDSPPFVSK